MGIPSVLFDDKEENTRSVWWRSDAENPLAGYLQRFGCLKDVCCAEKKGDCCELNVGAVVGTAIALLVVLVGSILACCKFCPGCPMNNAGKETEMTKV